MYISRSKPNSFIGCVVRPAMCKKWRKIWLGRSFFYQINELFSEKFHFSMFSAKNSPIKFEKLQCAHLAWSFCSAITVLITKQSMQDFGWSYHWRNWLNIISVAIFSSERPQRKAEIFHQNVVRCLIDEIAIVNLSWGLQICSKYQLLSENVYHFSVISGYFGCESISDTEIFGHGQSGPSGTFLRDQVDGNSR